MQNVCDEISILREYFDTCRCFTEVGLNLSKLCVNIRKDNPSLMRQQNCTRRHIDGNLSAHHHPHNGKLDFGNANAVSFEMISRSFAEFQ